MNNVILSVVIVNYNGYEYVKKCVESVFRSATYHSLEVIVVDNGSTDDSPRLLKKDFRQYANQLTVVSLKKNYGPARARNVGVRRSRGQYLAFLDNDTLVDSDWAITAIERFRQDKLIGIIQCKLLLAGDHKKIDYIGEYLGQNGFLVQRAPVMTVDVGQFEKECPVLAAKSAGMLITKKAFIDAGGFDDDYFIYVEETDLGWRCWLAGYKVLYCPGSIVYHEFGTSSIILSKQKNNFNAKFHGCKNYILTLIKNLEILNVIKILPLHIVLWLGLAWFALLRREIKPFLWIHQAILWNVINFGRTIRKRNEVQATRLISDRELFKIVLRKKPMSYFISKATVKQKVGNAESFIKTK